MIERKEYQMCQCSTLNVCRKSHAWNGSFFMTLSKDVIMYNYTSIAEYASTCIWKLLAFQVFDSPHTFNAWYRNPLLFFYDVVLLEVITL